MGKVLTEPPVLIGSPVELGAVGSGGNVEISASNLSLTNGGQIQAAYFRTG